VRPTTHVMSDLLRKYRHDGKRYWLKDARGIWCPISAGSMTLQLTVNLKIPEKQAVPVRKSLKVASNKANDPEWAEQVRWRNFTEGRELYVFLGKVAFCDPSSGWSKRSMKIRAFNKKLRRDFPSKPQIPEDSPL